MDCSVPALISGHREARLCKYIICINTRCLLPLHLRHVQPPPLITKPYYFLLSLSHDLQVSWPPLLRHRNVKNGPCRNVLVHTVVTADDVPPNCPHHHVHKCLTNGGGNPIVCSITKASSQKPAALPIYAGSPTPSECGCYDPQL